MREDKKTEECKERRAGRKQERRRRNTSLPAQTHWWLVYPRSPHATFAGEEKEKKKIKVFLLEIPQTKRRIFFSHPKKRKK